MRRIVWLILFFALGSMSAESIEPHRAYQIAPPRSFRFGLYGYDNPALLVYLHQPDILFTWVDKEDTSGFNDYALFFGIPGLGFGMIKYDTTTDYRISSGLGNKRIGLGIGYGWSTGKETKNHNLSIGGLYRPSRYLSFSVNTTFYIENTDHELALDIGLRPLGNEKVTLFGEYPIKKGI